MTDGIYIDIYIFQLGHSTSKTENNDRLQVYPRCWRNGIVLIHRRFRWSVDKVHDRQHDDKGLPPLLPESTGKVLDICGNCTVVQNNVVILYR